MTGAGLLFLVATISAGEIQVPPESLAPLDFGVSGWGAGTGLPSRPPSTIVSHPQFYQQRMVGPAGSSSPGPTGVSTACARRTTSSSSWRWRVASSSS
jgi:hypothetical protein